MQLSAIDRSITAYNEHTDPEAAFRLRLLAPILRETARIAANLPKDAVRVKLPDAEDIDALRRGSEPFLRSGAAALSAEVFESVMRKLAEVHTASLKDAGFDAPVIDWTVFAGTDAVNVLAKDPEAFLTDAVEAAFAAGMDEQNVDLLLIPVLSMAVRAMLDALSEAVSAKLAAGEDPVVDYDRRLDCPVCGSHAALAVVASTANTGHVKQLCCTRCGGHWKFERIRCAHCGEEAVSDLHYVHDEEDEAHRLHVCAACGEATPTYFAPGEFGSVSPDVESIVLGVLEAAWREQGTGRSASTASSGSNES